MPGAREFVPWTNRQAIVAAENAVADRRPQFMGDRPLMLDSQIRDAAPRVETIGSGEGIGRAGVETALTGAAMVLFRHVRIEREAQVDLAEEQPGAELARHQIGVLALPADPGLLRQRL